ncbi:MAG: hypothetical protein ACYS8W_16440 [Planctomycetota bacterium]|jgi:hypothetical protein
MDENQGKPKVLGSFNYLEDRRDEIIAYIAKKTTADPDVNKRCRKLIAGADPHMNYTKTGFASEFSNIMGLRVHGDLFIEAMGAAMPDLLPAEKVKELAELAADYKLYHTKDYYREGFGELVPKNLATRDDGGQ